MLGTFFLRINYRCMARPITWAYRQIQRRQYLSAPTSDPIFQLAKFLQGFAEKEIIDKILWKRTVWPPKWAVLGTFWPRHSAVHYMSCPPSNWWPHSCESYPWVTLFLLLRSCAPSLHLHTEVDISCMRQLASCHMCTQLSAHGCAFTPFRTLNGSISCY